MTTGALQGYYTVCIECGSPPLVRSPGRDDHRARTLRCSSASCRWSRSWVTAAAWGHRNCQGHTARLEPGITTALAIKPPEHQVVEFRRCTGHCCDPVTLSEDPGYFRRWRRASFDAAFIADELVYLGWRPPSRGGWPGEGTHEYRCPHFDPVERRCAIYGTGKRPPVCRDHPEYSRGPWETCGKKGCTRRTMVLGPVLHPRWRFPDLWELDLERWEAWEHRVCQPETGPEAMPEGSAE